MYKNRSTNYPLNEVRPISNLRQIITDGEMLRGDKAAYKFKESKDIKTVTFRDLREEVDSVGTALCVLGISDKHIAIIGENSFDWIRAYIAVLCSEGVVVPIDKELPNEEIEHILNFSDSTVVIYSKGVEDKINAISENLPNITHFICMSDPSVLDDNHYNLKDLIEEGRKLLKSGDTRFASLVPEMDGLKELLFTSGTTGKSKGVMLSQRALCFNIENSLKILHIEDSSISVLPYHHSYESTTGILTMLYKGMSIMINENLRSLMPNFKIHKPTDIQLVPLFVEKMYRSIWDKIEEQGKVKLVKAMIKVSNGLLKVGIDMRRKFFKSIHETFGGNLIMIICGGAPLKPFLPLFFDAIGITLINGYGISECGPLVSINRNHYRNYNSVGVPMPGIEIKIDAPNEAGEGEICVKGPNVMLGYYKNQESTDEVIIDGWFHTGDMGKMDDKGFLYITGRLKNVIILKNGKNIYPEEIEDKLCAVCQYIAEVVVSAHTRDDNEEAVLGAEIFPDFDRAKQHNINDVESEIKKAISKYNEKEANHKVIKNIKFRNEEFIKTTSKKIKRNLNN